MTSESDLTKKRCKPCEGGVNPMDNERAARLIEQLPGWVVSDDGDAICRQFKFGNFHQTMAFINAMAWIANQENHHPDFAAGYNYCEVTYTTHAVGGLSENDFICAAKINALMTD